MLTKLSFVLLVLLIAPIQALFAGSTASTVLDTLGPLPIRQIQIESVDSVLVSRYDLAKLQFARQTLLELDFSDVDQLIDVLKERAQLSQQGREQLLDITQTYLVQLQDSLGHQAKRIDQLSKQVRRAGGHVERATQLVGQAGQAVQVARRRMWWERIGTGLLGVGFGIAVRSVW